MRFGMPGEGSSLARPDTIQAGDLAVVYLGHNNMKAVIVKPAERLQTKYATFKLSAWIGLPFGSKVYDDAGGWVHLLRPTAELWSQVLRHRTQILYVADISLICSGLNLRPGCSVLESGTGSGSLTHSLARVVGSTGHVHTFEFHEQRWKEACAEFSEHGLDHVVTCMHRDIEALGFPEELHGCADGILLDLPGPWKVVQSAAACLKPSGMFCAFSPCIEQIQQTAGRLRETGYTDVRCVECLLRQYDVRRETVRRIRIPTPALERSGPDGDEGGAGPAPADAIATAAGAVDTTSNAAADVAQDLARSAVGQSATETSQVDGVGVASAEADIEPKAAAAVQDGDSSTATAQDGSRAPARGVKRAREAAPAPEEEDVFVSEDTAPRHFAQPIMGARGHTGYLVFARKLVPIAAHPCAASAVTAPPVDPAAVDPSVS